MTRKELIKKLTDQGFDVVEVDIDDPGQSLLLISGGHIMGMTIQMPVPGNEFADHSERMDHIYRHIRNGLEQIGVRGTA